MGNHENIQRFIPFRKSQIIEMLVNEGELHPEECDNFRKLCRMIESIFHFEFHAKEKFLTNNYYPFNPDKDTKNFTTYSNDELVDCEENLVSKFIEVLDDANYERITEEHIQHAMRENFLSNISLHVDMDDYERQIIYFRGENIHTQTVKKWFFKTVEIEAPVFERLAILTKFKNDDYFEAKKIKNPNFIPGSIVIKLFKNIPKADLEMLFPNAHVKMRLKDALVMGGSIVGGGIGITLKAGAGLVAFVIVLWSLITSYITGGTIKMPEPAQTAQLIGGVSALGIIGGFVWKQYNNYKNRKIQFMKTLSDNLYFKNLDNNTGVFHYLINSAEEEECKEAILAYYFLHTSNDSLTKEKLDEEVEQWLESKNSRVNFEIGDALEKLKQLDICMADTSTGENNPLYTALPIGDALRQIDLIWDDYFQYTDKPGSTNN